MTPPLDTFETQLLHELRATVQVGRPVDRRRRWRPVHWPQGVAAATVAVVCGAVAVVSLSTTPAFAVDARPGGIVEVEVNRLEDAAGLERALEEQGVAADVQYLGRQQKCAPGRYREAPVDLSYRSRSVYTLGGDGITVTLDRRDVAGGRTLVITAALTRDGSAGSIGIADGPVGPCRLVDDADGT
ncbi:MAG: hypothetical protein Q7T56_06250 [Nocardioidaceae bacterium]|nr:hypothetical protein [Nocardioidaceae bacterium]